MKFKLTCNSCEHVMDLEGTIHVDRFQCEKCGGDIQLRAGRMEEGVRIAGKYQTLFKTNDDGYSSSFICKDLNDEALHLLRIYDKTLSKLLTNPEEFMELISSVSFMAGANHMPIIDAGISQEYMYQVMPFRKLESLEQLIEFGYLWDAEQALDLIYELVNSLEEGVAKIGTGHFNLNPNNIFISNKGKVRYQGFGLAPQLLLEKKFVESDFSVFDIFYMSPELAKGKHYPTESSDVYSLGMILYYMMTGLTPRTAKDNEIIDYAALKFPITIQQKLNNHFLVLFAKMTTVDSQHRYKNMRELKQAIEAYFSTIGHTSFLQMKGEKTDLYKQDLYTQKVTDLLNPLANVELKAITSSTIDESRVRKRMATQTSMDIQLDLSEKIHNPKRVRRRRLKAPTNPKRIHREKVRQVQTQQNKSNSLLVSTTCLIIGIALSAVLIMALSKGKAEKPLVQQGVNEELELDLVIDDGPLEETRKDSPTKQTFSINKKFYELQLRKAEIDFDLLDKTLASDLSKAESDRHKQLLEKYAKRIDLAKQDAQRRILIDLKSEAGGLIFNKKPNEARALYLEYEGPFVEETLEQRKQLASEIEVITKKLLVKEEHEEIKIENLKKVDLDEKVELIAEYLLTDKVLLAIVNSKKLLELDRSPEIRKFVEMITESSEESLVEMILTNLAKSEEALIDVEFNNKSFKAKVISCDLDEASVKLLINFASGQLSREYPLENIPVQTLLKWVTSEDPSKQVFLRSMYSVHRADLLSAARTFQNYEGLFKETLLSELNKRLSIEANVLLEELFTSFNYPHLEKKEKVLAKDDAVAFEHAFSSILRKYDGLVDLDRGEYYQGLQEKLKASLPSLQVPQVFIGLDPTSKNQLQDLLTKSRFTVRLLPGEYENGIKVSGKKINIIGTKNVEIEGNVTISGDDVSLKNLHIYGDLILTQDVSGVSIKNCLIEGAILLREDVDKLEVDNSIFYGISGKEAEKALIKQSLLFKPKYALKAVINGDAEWEFINCIIQSDETLINFPQKAKKGDFVHCLLYTSKAVGVKKGESFYSLDEADGELGDFDKCLFVKPKYKHFKAGDYQLLEFSPGYQEGYKKATIGVLMNEDLDLRRADD